MQYHRSYSGNIVIDPQDTLPDGPRPGVYSGRAYLKLWRKWRTKEKPLGAKYAFIAAFRQAGVPIDLKTLRTCLNDKSLALIGTEERTLLRIYSEIVCQRPQLAREKLTAFETRFHAPEGLSEEDRKEYEHIELLTRYAEFKREHDDIFIRIGLPAEQPAKLIDGLMKAGLRKEAGEVFAAQLKSERYARADFSPLLKETILNHPDLLGTAGTCLRLIDSGRILEGIQHLLSLEREGGDANQRKESVLQTVLLTASAVNPAYGSAESWEKAEREALALMPGEASVPNRGFFKLKGRPKERKIKGPEVTQEEFDRRYELEARRFLRLHHWLRLQDYRALSRELGVGGLTPLEASFRWAIELRSLLLRGAPDDEFRKLKRPRQGVCMKGSNWLEVQQSLRNEFIRTGVIPFTIADMRDPDDFFDHNSYETALGLAVVKLAQLLTPQRPLASAEACREADEIMNRILTAGESAAPETFESLFAALCGIPPRERGIEWWRAAVELLKLKASANAFSQDERVGIMVRAFQLNQYAPGGDKVLANFLRMKLQNLMQFENLTNQSVVNELRLPLAFGLPWFKTVERELGPILSWRVFNNGINAIVVESKADPKRVFILTTNLDECVRLRLRPGQPEPSSHYEIAMQMEKRDLGEDYEAFVEQAGTIITANLINGSFEESEYGVIQLKTGEKLVKGFPFTEVLMSRHEKVVRAPLWDEGGKAIQFASLLFLKELEAVAEDQFGVDGVLSVRPRDFFLLAKRRRTNAFPAPKPLVEADAVPKILADLPCADDRCFVDRAVMEKGMPVEAVMPVSRHGSGETQLYFTSRKGEDPELSIIFNPRDSMVVAVKQVLVLEPALQYVMKDAYEDIFVRDGEGFRRLDDHDVFSASQEAVGPVGLA